MGRRGDQLPAWLRDAPPSAADEHRGQLQVHAGRGQSVALEVADLDSGESLTVVVPGGAVDEVIASMRAASRRQP